MTEMDFNFEIWKKSPIENPELKELKVINKEGMKYLKYFLNLQQLNCSYIGLTSLQGLENCINLQELYCSNNKLANLEGIQNCNKLQLLHCNNNQLISLKGLEGCINLEILVCDINQLISLQGLEGYINLKKCYCSYNKLTSLQGLEGCINLKKLYCFNNKLTSLQGLENCRNLKELNCFINQLTSLQGIENCINLQYLYCDNNQLTSLQGLEGCINLQILNCSNNHLTSLQGLEGCRNLQKLYYSNNEIDYIPPNIQRILDRNIQGIYNDSQNVHNHNIQDCIRKSIQNIINIKPRNKNIIEMILNDTILDKETKEILINYCQNKEIHTTLNITFEELLIHIWNRIESLKDKEEIKKIIGIEMKDSICKCFTGRISRLINCLNGFDSLVEIKIADAEQIGIVISKIKMELGESYKIEKHKELVEEELKSYGYSSQIIDEWISYIE